MHTASRIITVLLLLALCRAAPAQNLIAALSPVQQLTGNNPIVLGNLGLGQQFTISIWVKPAGGNPEWAAIVDYRHSATKSFAFHQLANKTHHYSFGVHSANKAQGVYVDLQESQWQHVTLVKTNTLLTAYIDGKPVSESALTPPFEMAYAGDEILTIGGWGYGERRWLGSVSCLVIFDAPLSHDEVLKLHLEQPQCGSNNH